MHCLILIVVWCDRDETRPLLAAQEPLVSAAGQGQGKGKGLLFAVSRDKLQAMARALRAQYPGQPDRQAAALAWIAVYLHAYIYPQFT